MRWYTVLESWESVKGESSSLGVANAQKLQNIFLTPMVAVPAVAWSHPIWKHIWVGRYNNVKWLLLEFSQYLLEYWVEKFWVSFVVLEGEFWATPTN